MKRRKKIKIFSLALCAVMLLSLPSAVYASPPGEEAYISQGEIALHAYADETGGAVEENALPAAQPFTLELETPSYKLM